MGSGLAAPRADRGASGGAASRERPREPDAEFESNGWPSTAEVLHGVRTGNDADAQAESGSAPVACPNLIRIGQRRERCRAVRTGICKRRRTGDAAGLAAQGWIAGGSRPSVDSYHRSRPLEPALVEREDTYG